MKEEAVKVNIIFFINNIFNFIFLLYISRYINAFKENASFQNLIYFNHFTSKDLHINTNQKLYMQYNN